MRRSIALLVGLLAVLSAAPAAASSHGLPSIQFGLTFGASETGTGGFLTQPASAYPGIIAESDHPVSS